MKFKVFNTNTGEYEKGNSYFLRQDGKLFLIYFVMGQTMFHECDQDKYRVEVEE